MGTGKLATPELSRVLEEVRDIPGDFAEVGVYQGHLFNRLAWAAHREDRIAHAFDSFEGMAEPGPLDDGNQYPAGALSSGGVEAFQKRLTAPYLACILWPGFIPQCFDGCVARFAFAYIDVDHHEPTRQAIEWIWPRIYPGGVIGFDDYFPGRAFLATPAIEDFLAMHLPEVAGYRVNTNRQLFATKARSNG